MKGTNKLELNRETVQEIFQKWVDRTFVGCSLVVANLDHSSYYGTTLTLRDAREKAAPIAPPHLVEPAPEQVADEPAE